MRHRSSIIYLILGVTLAHSLGAGQFRLRSTDLDVPMGSKILVDGKDVGTAPCAIELTTDYRHRIEIKAQDGTTRLCFLTVREVKKSEEVADIPAWFLNPTLLQSDFPDYETLTPATGFSRTISDAIGKAESQRKSESANIRVDHYNTIREPGDKSKLDSTKSKYYPKLTRGQMDSLADVNGGMMVASSYSGSSEATVLEYEIQKSGDGYRAYILTGRRNK